MEIKKHFWRNGFQYSLVRRKNYLAGYAGSLNGKIAHYIICEIVMRGDTEQVNFNDDFKIANYEEFISNFERIVNRQLKKQNHAN